MTDSWKWIVMFILTLLGVSAAEYQREKLRVLEDFVRQMWSRSLKTV